MKTVISIWCFAVVVGVCSAHMCLINPQQRGMIENINKAVGIDEVSAIFVFENIRPASKHFSQFAAIFRCQGGQKCLAVGATNVKINNVWELQKKCSDSCILLTGPCGGKPNQPPNTMYRSMSNITVTFQKNLDHWVKATPGHFSVTLWWSSGKMMELTTVPDMGEPSLTLYQASAMLPKEAIRGQYIIQVQYVTMNPQAPAVFYQCADVMIM